MEWWLGMKELRLYRDSITVTDYYKSSLNTCSPGNYSLGIQNIPINLSDTEYTCWRSGELLAVFKIKIEVTPTVKILFSHDNYPSTEAVVDDLTCVIYRAIQPFNITWFVDGLFHKQYMFNDRDRSIANFNSTISATSVPFRRNFANISCQIDGPFVAFGSNFIVLRHTFGQNDTGKASLNKMQFSSWQTNDDAAVNTRTSVLAYDDINDEEGDDTPVDVHGSSFSTLTAETSGKATSLLVCLKTSTLFEYWSAQYFHNERNQKCFAKVLSGSATVDEARSFQELALNLRSLKEHSNLVKIVYIAVDEGTSTNCMDVPEAVFNNQYTEASDVWGLAVLFWELYSFGALPLVTLSNSEVEQRMAEGLNLPQPSFCPAAMYNMMVSCWDVRKGHRPTFKEIQNQINDIFNNLEKEKQKDNVFENEQLPYFVLEG
ncbi:TKL protein kinase [Apostichopus japonicus]|uniref:TKL protein kinase n=1 Tax=Stichopus japonicus TaxID=307972 RepID=A0A2G8KH88_STIJA|nr:TKL protein kinase [Apostichopus japonicus]